MQFLVRYVPNGGSAVAKFKTVATSAEEARARAGRQGVVLSVQRTLSLRGTRSRFDVDWWCKELSTLLRSGMTVVEALDVLCRSAGEPARQSVLADLLQRVEAGVSLSRAMAEVGAFPAVLVASVSASERASTLQEVLQDYLRHQMLIDRLKRRAVSAAVYPALVMTLGFAVVAFLLLYVVPRFSQIYVDSTAKISDATSFVLTVSSLIREHWWFAAFALLAFALGSLAAWQLGLHVRVLSWIVERALPLRRQHDHFRLAKVYQSLMMMYRGGYTYVEALEVCKSLDIGPRFDDAVLHAITLVQQGRGVSNSMAAVGLADLPDARMLAAGERSGNFDHALQIVAERHALAFETFLERATRIVEPMLLLIVAVGVGSVVVLMYMPVFDLASSVGR
jgi:general secretion pathway protein F